MIFTTAVTAQPLIASGKLKTLAVAGNKRLAIYPEVPTAAEQGLAGFDVLIWFGVAVPPATPKPIVLKLNRDLQQTLQDADIKARFASLGLEPQGGSPERFAEFLREDTARWAKVVKAANVRNE